MENKNEIINMICAIGGYNTCIEQLGKNKYISKKELKKLLGNQMECLERLEKAIYL